MYLHVKVHVGVDTCTVCSVYDSIINVSCITMYYYWYAAGVLHETENYHVFILNRKQDQRYTTLQGKYWPLKERMSTYISFYFIYSFIFSLSLSLLSLGLDVTLVLWRVWSCCMLISASTWYQPITPMRNLSSLKKFSLRSSQTSGASTYSTQSYSRS